MPVYTFACPQAHRVEVLLPMDQRNQARTCAVCGETVTRQLEFQIAHRVRKQGVMHIPGYPPARLSHEQARAKQRDNNPFE